MASLKLAAAALAFALLCAAATTATAYRPAPKPAPMPKPEPETCKRQLDYFKNCLRLGFGETCCGDEHVLPVAEQRCYCELEREAQIECAPKRHCGGIEGKVKIAELNLWCLSPKKLKCKRA